MPYPVSVKEAIQEALLISSATPAGYLPKRIPAKLWRSWIMHNTGAPGSSTSVFFRGVWMRKMSDAATRARFMAVSYKQLAAPREACLMMPTRGNLPFQVVGEEEW
ncbi:hypothetical protein N7530_006299 [Penicillium desertorum]|uniref:Uncharacterized protein n=1 Tax=Penicillium desertorum TaxID=1303715 RepID=A0A9X0BMC2_9EURO|nr:hypothetical protein N7530_006299 [Penicillium desertorum]